MAEVFSGSMFRATNTKCRPSGRNAGWKWATSPRAASIVVTGRGVPPEAETATIGVPNSFVKRIVPSRPQAPKKPLPLSQIVWTGPPSTPTRLSLPSAKNAISRPSGDQKAPRASSVPGMPRISRPSSERSAIEVRPPASWTQRRTRRASGESEGGSEEALAGAGHDRETQRLLVHRSGTVRQQRHRGDNGRRGRDDPGESLAPPAPDGDDRSDAGGGALRDPLQLLADVAGATASGPRDPWRGTSSRRGRAPAATSAARRRSTADPPT